MSDDSNFMRDIVIPTVLIVGMFVVNAFVFAYIMYHRKRIVYEEEPPKHSNGAGMQQPPEAVAFEMDHL